MKHWFPGRFWYLQGAVQEAAVLARLVAQPFAGGDGGHGARWHPAAVPLPRHLLPPPSVSLHSRHRQLPVLCIHGDRSISSRREDEEKARSGPESQERPIKAERVLKIFLLRNPSVWNSESSGFRLKGKDQRKNFRNPKRIRSSGQRWEGPERKRKRNVNRLTPSSVSSYANQTFPSSQNQNQYSGPTRLR